MLPEEAGKTPTRREGWHDTGRVEAGALSDAKANAITDDGRRQETESLRKDGDFRRAACQIMLQILPAAPPSVALTNMCITCTMIATV